MSAEDWGGWRGGGFAEQQEGGTTTTAAATATTSPGWRVKEVKGEVSGCMTAGCDADEQKREWFFLLSLQFFYKYNSEKSFRKDAIKAQRELFFFINNWMNSWINTLLCILGDEWVTLNYTHKIFRAHECYIFLSCVSPSIYFYHFTHWIKDIYSKPNTPFFLPPFWPPPCGA